MALSEYQLSLTKRPKNYANTCACWLGFLLILIKKALAISFQNKALIRAAFSKWQPVLLISANYCYLSC